MTNLELLENYLLNRPLFEPKNIVDAVISGKTEVSIGEEVLNNDELLTKCAGIYQDNQKTLEAVIRSRMFPLIVELVLSAEPQETIVIRQSILELAGLLDDFKKYHEEFLRRKEVKNRTNITSEISE